MATNSAPRTLRPAGSHRLRRRPQRLCHRRRPWPPGPLGHLPLPPALELLESWPVIAASSALFAIEFFASKIPAFDLIWSALHTFVRIPIAALIAYRAAAQLTPAEQLLATLLGAAIAMVAHGGKTAIRASVTPSPEPFSNISLSLAEDALAVALTWLATRHPYVAGTIALILVVIIVLLARFVIRALRSLFRGAEDELAGRRAP
ncbi:MAG TPA: DUF4126 domain-containing protein [Candidatus Eremiobacteraceae bacterium]|nr:DUF4126 domain-containing protein [Candidatus Eremiobacteraceae bacterium]